MDTEESIGTHDTDRTDNILSHEKVSSMFQQASVYSQLGQLLQAMNAAQVDKVRRNCHFCF